MAATKKLRCILMGEQSRLIQCTELLIQRGHEIFGIITEEETIKKWAIAHKLPLISPTNDIAGWLKTMPFDIFFSIDNFMKVPSEILTMPQLFAINFHDAPLPRYAGNNATNWALINQEEVHGVTWHVMTDKIDAGDILKQSIFPINKNDRGITLNAKCYEESIRCFEDMIEEIGENRQKVMGQNLNARTFYPRWKRPWAACTINWEKSAEEIDALCRGLDFGTYPNPLGLLKLFLGKDTVVVKNVELLKATSDEPAGTIMGIENGSLYAATTTQNIALSMFRSLKGDAFNPEDVLSAGHLKIGERFANLDEHHAQRITEAHSKFCKYETYWVKRLEHVSPVEIPYAKSHTLRGAQPTYSQIVFNGPNEFLHLEMAPAENSGDLLMAAFFLYLHRICDKCSFDIAYSNLSLKNEIRGVEAYFPPFVPLPIEAEPDHNFEQFADGVFKNLSETKQHGSYLRDLIFRYPELIKLVKNDSIAKLTLSVERLPNTTNVIVTSDSDLHIVIPDDGKKCLWQYNQNVIDKNDIKRMHAQFYTLLSDLSTKDRNCSISQLSILPEEERRMLIKEWNHTFVDYLSDICLHQLFESQVKQTPDAVALDYEGSQMSYRELNTRANQMARYLIKNDVGPETLVGLFMERSLEMVIGIYGIIKAGGAYVPLDPEYPPERISYMINDTKVPILLTQNHLKAALPENKAKVVCLDSEWNRVAEEQTDNPDSHVAADNLAYVIYTSGSTGKPKGVMNEHRGICNRLLWMQDEYKLTHSDRVLQKTPFSFDVSVWEFFWPLLFGARLVIARPGGHKDSAYLVKLINEKEITTLHFVPSMLQIFLEEKAVETCRSVKRVICSGEALPYDLQKRFFKRLGSQLHNLYGPTEAAVDVTYWACRPESDRSIVPIGYPVANTQIYVLDTRLQPVPVGVTGELHIGGVQVARGYLNRPELTTEKFIPDPFRKEQNARLYKTGDLARFLADGSVEYLGRTDFQVKIRGLRIELGEIETLISEYPNIKQCVVLLREDRPGDKRLVAYFVCEPNQKVNDLGLREYLKIKLPDYMVPQYFVALDAIPLSPNGKADRRALPMVTVNNITQETYIPPRNKIEKLVAEIWQDLLQVPTVGINDSFFDLGGHSLLLVQALQRLKASMAVELSVVDFFQYPTVSSLTAFLSRHKKAQTSFAKTRQQIEKQIESLKRQKQMAMARVKNFG